MLICSRDPRKGRSHLASNSSCSYSLKSKEFPEQGGFNTHMEQLTIPLKGVQLVVTLKTDNPFRVCAEVCAILLWSDGYSPGVLNPPNLQNSLRVMVTNHFNCVAIGLQLPLLHFLVLLHAVTVVSWVRSIGRDIQANLSDHALLYLMMLHGQHYAVRSSGSRIQLSPAHDSRWHLQSPSESGLFGLFDYPEQVSSYSYVSQFQ